MLMSLQLDYSHGYKESKKFSISFFSFYHSLSIHVSVPNFVRNNVIQNLLLFDIFDLLNFPHEN